MRRSAWPLLVLCACARPASEPKRVPAAAVQPAPVPLANSATEFAALANEITQMQDVVPAVDHDKAALDLSRDATHTGEVLVWRALAHGFETVWISLVVGQPPVVIGRQPGIWVVAHGELWQMKLSRRALPICDQQHCDADATDCQAVPAQWSNSYVEELSWRSATTGNSRPSGPRTPQGIGLALVAARFSQTMQPLGGLGDRLLWAVQTSYGPCGETAERLSTEYQLRDVSSGLTQSLQDAEELQLRAAVDTVATAKLFEADHGSGDAQLRWLAPHLALSDTGAWQMTIQVDRPVSGPGDGQSEAGYVSVRVPALRLPNVLREHGDAPRLQGLILGGEEPADPHAGYSWVPSGTAVSLKPLFLQRNGRDH